MFDVDCFYKLLNAVPNGVLRTETMIASFVIAAGGCPAGRNAIGQLLIADQPDDPPNWCVDLPARPVVQDHATSCLSRVEIVECPTNDCCGPASVTITPISSVGGSPMCIETARMIAAGIWCHPAYSHVTMNVHLAEYIADLLCANANNLPMPSEVLGISFPNCWMDRPTDVSATVADLRKAAEESVRNRSSVISVRTSDGVGIDVDPYRQHLVHANLGRTGLDENFQVGGMRLADSFAKEVKEAVAQDLQALREMKIDPASRNAPELEVRCEARHSSGRCTLLAGHDGCHLSTSDRVFATESCPQCGCACGEPHVGSHDMTKPPFADVADAKMTIPYIGDPPHHHPYPSDNLKPKANVEVLTEGKDDTADLAKCEDCGEWTSTDDLTPVSDNYRFRNLCPTCKDKPNGR